jgi:DNA-binding winged helix-turn-helix (wHTH) protein
MLDVARRELWRGCEPVVVEPQVFDLLAYLVRHPERVVTKDQLLQAVLRRQGVILDRTGSGSLDCRLRETM